MDNTEKAIEIPPYVGCNLVEEFLAAKQQEAAQRHDPYSHMLAPHRYVAFRNKLMSGMAITALEYWEFGDQVPPNYRVPQPQTTDQQIAAQRSPDDAARERTAAWKRDEAVRKARADEVIPFTTMGMIYHTQHARRPDDGID